MLYWKDYNLYIFRPLSTFTYSYYTKTIETKCFKIFKLIIRTQIYLRDRYCDENIYVFKRQTTWNGFPHLKIKRVQIVPISFHFSLRTLSVFYFGHETIFVPFLHSQLFHELLLCSSTNLDRLSRSLQDLAFCIVAWRSQTGSLTFSNCSEHQIF